MRLARRRRPPRRPLTGVVVVLGLTLLLGCGSQDPQRPPHGTAEITVMTQNLYLGGDIGRPLRAARGRSGSEAALALGRAAQDLRATVDRTDFGVRAQLLATEMVTTEADVVGLQEVTLWRHGPLRLDPTGPPAATIVDVDFLATLLGALEKSGHPYDVASSRSESDVEAPAFADRPTEPGARNVRLTVGDAVLVRRGSGLVVGDHDGTTFGPRFAVDVAGIGFRFVRGAVWTDFSRDGTRFRFVSTHLESESSDVALAQSQELLAGPALTTDAATIAVCDCNSDPADGRVRAGSTVPDFAAYRALTQGGFRDLWTEVPGAGPGFTALLSETVDDPVPSFDHRLDLVLGRDAGEARITVVSGQVIGDHRVDRDAATGLWPSDHAGVVVRVRIGA